MAGLALLLGVLTAPAAADPGASRAKLEQRVRLRLGPERITVEHRLTMNRPAAFLEVVRIDRNGDGELGEAEQKRYFKRVGRALSGSLALRIDGERVPLEPTGEVRLEKPLTKHYRFTAPQPKGWRDGASLEFHNDAYLAATRVAGLTVETAEGVAILSRSRGGGGDGESRTTGPTSGPRGSVGTSGDRDLALRYAGADAANAAGAAGANSSNPFLLRQRIIFGALGVAAFGALGVLVLLGTGRDRATLRSRAVPVAALGLLLLLGTGVALGLGVWGRRAAAPDRPKQRFRQLHEHIYRAYTAPNESRMYDELAEGLAGEALEAMYDRLYRATLENPDGPRVRLTRVRPVRTELLGGGSEGNEGTGGVGPSGRVRLRHRWRVYGTVTHYGHRHARARAYEAVYTMDRVEAGWRIVEAEVETMQRVPMERWAALRPLNAGSDPS